MTSIDMTPREKICCFTYFLTPELNFAACSKKTSRFSLNRLDYSNERIKSTLPANDDYLAQNQTFSHNQKYMTPKQNH